MALLLKSGRFFLNRSLASWQARHGECRTRLTSTSSQILHHWKPNSVHPKAHRRTCEAHAGAVSCQTYDQRTLTRGTHEASDPQAAADAEFMAAALKQAEQAAAKGEVPVGAVLVHDGEIIAEGHNLVEAADDPTAHAEMLVIRQAAKLKGGRWHLRDATLYVTLEPCAMCAGAILVSRVGTVVYGARNSLLGADGSWTSLFPISNATDVQPGSCKGALAVWPEKPHPTHPDLQVRRGIRAAECGSMMQQFFQRRRQENKTKDIRKEEFDKLQLADSDI